MASDINALVLVGRITRDAELRYTASGTALSSFSIAVNRRVKKGEQWVDEASFIDITLWNKQAEGLNKYLTKGTQVAVQGSLEQQRWEKDGQKHSKLAVRVESVQLLGGQKGGGSSAPQRQSQGSDWDRYNPGEYEDDIPL